MDADGMAGHDPLVEAAKENGLSAAEVAALARRVDGRSCGDCTACCSVKSVRELGKPSQVACRHLCQGGCTIYPRRPTSCREYACLWRQGLIEGDQRRRPDRLGVIIDYEPFARVRGAVRLVVWEVVPGAAKSEKVRYVVDKLLQTYKQIRAVAYCAAGQPAHDDFPIDRQTYPDDPLPATLPIVAFDAARRVTTYDFRKAA
jgi:hypothetical protein